MNADNTVSKRQIIGNYPASTTITMISNIDMRLNLYLTITFIKSFNFPRGKSSTRTIFSNCEYKVSILSSFSTRLAYIVEQTYCTDLRISLTSSSFGGNARAISWMKLYTIGILFVVGKIKLRSFFLSRRKFFYTVVYPYLIQSKNINN